MDSTNATPALSAAGAALPSPGNDPSVFDRFARFYDDDYRDYDEDLGLLLELAEEAHGPVVELGCGTGRVLLPLTDAGHAVTGIDISPGLLGIARSKLTAAGLAGKANLVLGDLRAPELPSGAFALAICTSNTLMHVAAPDQQLQALTHAHRLLKAGGVLFVGLFNPDIPRLLEVNGLVELADQWHDAATGAEVLKWSVRSVDLAAQLQETTFIYEEQLPRGDVRKTVCPFTLRYLWRNEGELMLRAAGFKEIEVWGDYAAQPHDGLSENLLFLARK